MAFFARFHHVHFVFCEHSEPGIYISWLFLLIIQILFHFLLLLPLVMFVGACTCAPGHHRCHQEVISLRSSLKNLSIHITQSCGTCLSMGYNRTFFPVCGLVVHFFFFVWTMGRLPKKKEEEEEEKLPPLLPPPPPPPLPPTHTLPELDSEGCHLEEEEGEEEEEEEEDEEEEEEEQ